MIELPGLWSLSPLGALLGVLVLLFFGLNTGRLYTRRQHDEIVALHREALTEQKKATETWQQAASEYRSRSVVLSTPEAAAQVQQALDGVHGR